MKQLAWKLLILPILLVLPSPVLAITKIIVVPTARTIGAGRYAIELTHKSPFLDASSQRLDLTVKLGAGERAMFEIKQPLSNSGNSNVLFFGKYAFATANHNLSAFALGVENVGADSTTIPYFVISHLFNPVDVTVGFAGGNNLPAMYLAGVDYGMSDKLHLLADYNSGTADFASLGFQYKFSQQWTMKSGLEQPRNGSSDVLIKITYNSTY